MERSAFRDQAMPPMSNPPSSPTSPAGNAASTSSTETIVLGGGCFWCTEAVFDRVQGVVDVESGYSNGQVARPTYEQVCTGRTGAVEVVRVVFDPSAITLRELLEIFFVIHDPTTLNRQGNDVGTQYRSGIYTTNDDQVRVARDVIREIGESGTYRTPIVTEVVPLADYSTAEAYHQDYFVQHPNQGYCAFVVGPKVEKFQKTFAARVKG
jgi:peptide-methionine (S)-S-oxide reductase